MKILALEFSSPQRSVAVADGGRAMSEAIETGGRGTNALGMIEAALREAKLEREQIECIVIGLGPGSYTGIRAALSIAQGWQLAREIKLLGISSVEAIAAQAQAEKIFGRVNVVIDAQRNELYLATHEITAGGRKEIEPLRIVPLAEIQSRASAGAIIVGPEVTRWFTTGRVLFPRAATLAQMAASRSDFEPGENLAPIYLRETNFVKAPPPRIL
jgi:tRNA threonylcarbamoyladenosine biosynthesis protein TsaB